MLWSNPTPHQKKGAEISLYALFFDFSQTTCRSRSSCLFWSCTRTFSRNCMQWHTRWHNRLSLHHPKEQSYTRQWKVRRRRQEQEETFSSDSPFLAAIAAIGRNNTHTKNEFVTLIKAGLSPNSTGYFAPTFPSMANNPQFAEIWPMAGSGSAEDVPVWIPEGLFPALRNRCSRKRNRQNDKLPDSPAAKHFSPGPG